MLRRGVQALQAEKQEQAAEIARLQEEIVKLKGQGDSAATHSLVFEPGGIGVRYAGDGVVTNVASGGQAERLGVMKGWQFHTLENTAYSEDRLDELMAGKKNYSVTFI